MKASDQTRTLRVLYSFNTAHSSRTAPNPYQTLLVESLPEGVDAIGFTWKEAFLGRYDVVHIHWPETLIRGSGAKRWLKPLLTALLLLRWRALRVPVVRTLHNVRPHEPGGPLEDFLLARLDGITSAWIVMNQSWAPPGPAPVFHIPHGHYRTWYSVPTRPPRTTRGRLVYFGTIHKYKGVEELIRAFVQLEVDSTLTVMGKPGTGELDASLRAAADGHENVQLDLRPVPDDGLIEALWDAELVILPYSDMNNSGSLLLALSLNKRVLVPLTAATAEMRDEVGPDWILTYQAPLDPAKLRSALDSARATAPAGTVDLTGRDWRELGSRHATVYRSVIADRR